MSTSHPLYFILFGTESTGKTTLAKQLGQHFSAPVADEYVREFWDANQGRISASDLGAIARGQLANHRAAAKEADRLLFCDTDLITNVLWADILFPGKCPDWVRQEANNRALAHCLYLFCHADIPFEEDPQRCFRDEAERQHYHQVWQQALIKCQLPYVDICGGWDERLATAIHAVKTACAKNGVAPYPNP